MNQGTISRMASVFTDSHRRQSEASFTRVARKHQRAQREDDGKEERGDELRHESEDEVQADRNSVRLLPPALSRRPAQKVIYAAAIAQEQRPFHVVCPKPVVEEQRPVDEQQHHRDGATHRTGEQAPDRKHVQKGHTAEERVPEAEAELIVRQQARADGRRDDPELQRRLFEEDGGFARTALGLKPVTNFENANRPRRNRSLRLFRDPGYEGR